MTTKTTTHYHIAWPMNVGGLGGPAIYALIPAEWAQTWRSGLRWMQTISDTGQASRLLLRPEQLCSCRSMTTKHGETSPQEEALIGLVATIRPSDRLAPEVRGQIADMQAGLLPTTHHPIWSGWDWDARMHRPEPEPTEDPIDTIKRGLRQTFGL